MGSRDSIHNTLIFLLTYEWAQYARVLQYTRLKCFPVKNALA
jgi:hypothetical protein